MAITILSPILSFAFEQFLGAVFPETYRKRIGPLLRTALRWLLNDSFFVELTYQLVFHQGGGWIEISGDGAAILPAAGRFIRAVEEPATA